MADLFIVGIVSGVFFFIAGFIVSKINDRGHASLRILLDNRRRDSLKEFLNRRQSKKITETQND